MEAIFPSHSIAFNGSESRAKMIYCNFYCSLFRSSFYALFLVELHAYDTMILFIFFFSLKKYCELEALTSFL
jgi:hypothetical protein